MQMFRVVPITKTGNSNSSYIYFTTIFVQCYRLQCEHWTI